MQNPLFRITTRDKSNSTPAPVRKKPKINVGSGSKKQTLEVEVAREPMDSVEPNSAQSTS